MTTHFVSRLYIYIYMYAKTRNMSGLQRKHGLVLTGFLLNLLVRWAGTEKWNAPYKPSTGFLFAGAKAEGSTIFSSSRRKWSPRGTPLHPRLGRGEEQLGRQLGRAGLREAAAGEAGPRGVRHQVPGVALRDLREGREKRAREAGARSGREKRARWAEGVPWGFPGRESKKNGGSLMPGEERVGWCFAGGGKPGDWTWEKGKQGLDVGI